MGTGIVDPVATEPDLTVVEAEERGEREDAISVRSIFVASAVDPEIVIVLEPFRMRQEHDPDGECPEVELVPGDTCKLQQKISENPTRT